MVFLCEPPIYLFVINIEALFEHAKSRREIFDKFESLLVVIDEEVTYKEDQLGNKANKEAHVSRTEFLIFLVTPLPEVKVNSLTPVIICRMSYGARNSV